MQDVGASKTDGVISEPLLIDQEKKCDSGFLTKQTGIVPIAQSDRSKGCALPLKSALVCAQLRDVLTAEDSAIVAQKNENSRAFFPERSKSMLVPIAIRQHDAGKDFTHRARHYPSPSSLP